jgi:hypothetical protein
MVEQFAAIDPKLAERARAKRAGFIEAEDDDDKALRKAPMSQKDLLSWQKDVIQPMLATYRYAALRAQGSARVPSCGPVAGAGLCEMPPGLASEVRRLLAEILVRDYLTHKPGDSPDYGGRGLGHATPPAPPR